MGLHHSSTCAKKIELFYNIPSLESISIYITNIYIYKILQFTLLLSYSRALREAKHVSSNITLTTFTF